MATIKCPYCAGEIETGKQKGELIRCEHCHKPFEIGVTRPRPAPASAAPAAPAPARYREKPAQDISATEFASGLGIARFVAFIGWFVILIALLSFLAALFSDKPMAGVALAIGALVSGCSLLLFAHIATATMKTADYARITALNSME
jgi:hypothetical protein